MIATSALLAARAIRRHLLRSFLTVLGIVIGVFAVVTMVTLGNAATRSVREQISSLGANVLTILPGGGAGRGGGQVPPPFKIADAEAVRDQIAGVTEVAPQVQTSATAVRNAANWSTTVTGAGNAFLDTQTWLVSDGRRFTQSEEEAGKSVCLLGSTVRARLYPTENALGSRLRVGGISCVVVGLLATRGQGGFGQDGDDMVIMPLKAVQRRFTGNQDIRVITVSADPAYDSAAIQNAIAALLRERRNITGTKQDDFTIFDQRQIADTLSGATTMLTTFVGAVAAISLLVGGIGIMNIMLVSVTERTREIGIRLAIGAVAAEVRMQFLVEAVVLSMLGGLIGIVLALGACFGLTRAFGLGFAFETKINLAAFLFSALIGVVFGYFPARRAALLDPIDALRHE
ncbi:ABC transporter permease [Sphingomonas morindae]|uniref:ABC transporter permease n=1 Tax=Sphingomonas morindae TaxID=1541170 RepID=A0ABY4XCN6_9SPHN|nr:ABC transporter permease [Sphingomonas morindae]USI74511.1 ABC transporter permease [Sphingomonas morindae]